MTIDYVESSTFKTATVDISPEDVVAFKELVHRGANLWPDAPASIKAFADIVTIGHVQQDYEAQKRSNAALTAINNIIIDTLNEPPKTMNTTPAILPPTLIDPIVEFKGVIIPSKFELDVKMFNEMYKLEKAKDQESLRQRLQIFKGMLLEEVDEIDEIIDDLEHPCRKLSVLTKLADLLGDLQVYCASEMVRHQIPVQATLDIIMSSNFSKLGADGKPIYREDGKVLKGPNYWKPEPTIHGMLKVYLESVSRMQGA